MTLAQLIAEIQANVTANGNRENTGARVQALLIEMAQFSDKINFFDTFSDFPSVGEDEVLYVTKDANVVYRYDTALNTYVLLNDPDITNPDAPEEGQTFYVRLATTTTLNACTYNNGTGGVGATLTGNANGLLSQTNQTGKIDNTTPVINDVILIKNQASALQNGIYEVTQPGDVSNPFILTRIDGYDETAEIYPSVVFVSAGSNNANRYFTQSTANPVIGTSSLVYQVATTAQPAAPVLFSDSVTQIALPACTYANGTAYVNAPGVGATLTSDSNGALGTLNGVSMTSGRRLLVKNQANQAHNGLYQVTNAGSATQRWVLTRVGADGNAFYRIREFVITNPACSQFGSRWTITSPLSMSNAAWGTTNIIISQQNTQGLIDSNGNVDITTVSGNAAITMYENTGSVEVAVDDYISLAASNNVNIFGIGGAVNIESPTTYIYNQSETTYIDVDGINRKIQMFADNGSGNEVTLDLNPNSYNAFRTNGSSIFLSIDNVSFQNSNLLLQNNSAALRCYSASAVVEVTAGSAVQGLALDRVTTQVNLFNNEGLIRVSSDTLVSLTDTAATNYIEVDPINDLIKLWSEGSISITADNGQIDTYGRIYAHGDIHLSDYIRIFGGDGNVTQNLTRAKVYLGNAGDDDFSWYIGNDNTGLAYITFDSTDLYINNTQASGSIIIGSDANISLTVQTGSVNIVSPMDIVLSDAGQNIGIFVSTQNNRIQTYAFETRFENAGGNMYYVSDQSTGDITITTGLGNINLNSTKLVLSQLPAYANDAAADADTALPSGGLYKITGSRAVYQKP